MPENISLPEVTSEKVVPVDTFHVFKNKLTQMVAEHKACLKRKREKEQAENEKFFALAMYQQTSELPSADNTTNYPPVMHDGINLMQIPAGARAAKFGRHLGCAVRTKVVSCKLSSLGCKGNEMTFGHKFQRMKEQNSKLLYIESIPSSQRRPTKTLGVPPTKWDSI